MEKNKVFIYLLAVFLAVFVGSSLFLLVNKPAVKKQPLASKTVEGLKQENITIPTAMPKEGSFSLESQTLTLKNGGTLTLNVSASLAEKNIVGYDLLVSYDKQAFDFVRVDSLLPDFKIYSHLNEGSLSLTAAKSLQSQTNTAVEETAVCQLVFQAKKAGRYNFSINERLGNEKTEFVTDKTELVYPTVNSLSIEVSE